MYEPPARAGFVDSPHGSRERSFLGPLLTTGGGRVLGDTLECLGQRFAGLEALGLGRLDHERLIDDQREVDRRRVETLFEKALGHVESAYAAAALERRGR